MDDTARTEPTESPFITASPNTSLEEVRASSVQLSPISTCASQCASGISELPARSMTSGSRSVGAGLPGINANAGQRLG